MSDGFVPPQNVEVEESVLGAILIAEPALRAVRVAGLQPGHFYLEKHRDLFAAIERVVQREGYVDQLMLADALPDHKHLIADLTAKVPAAGNALHYARIVMRHASLRQKLEGGRKIIAGVRAAQEGGDKGEEESEKLIREGQALVATDLTIEAAPTSASEVGQSFIDYINSTEPDEVMRLPFDDLSECMNGGYRRRQLSILGGWPGMCKSWLLDQTLMGFAEQGYRPAIFATEMSRIERSARVAVMKTGIPYEKLIRKRLTDDEKRRVEEAMATMPFAYFECNGYDVDTVCERAIFGGFDVVAVDVVNFLRGYEEEVAEANRVLTRLATLAQDANCHVIGVAHLNRQRDVNKQKPRPVNRDLRQTAVLEGIAHAIMFIHRDQDEEGAKEPGAEVFFTKTRNGLEGSVRVFQNSRFLTFAPEAHAPPDEVFGDVDTSLPGYVGAAS